MCRRIEGDEGNKMEGNFGKSVATRAPESTRALFFEETLKKNIYALSIETEEV
jgi:hypothetical protein